RSARPAEWRSHRSRQRQSRIALLRRRRASAIAATSHGYDTDVRTVAHGPRSGAAFQFFGSGKNLLHFGLPVSVGTNVHARNRIPEDLAISGENQRGGARLYPRARN